MMRGRGKDHETTALGTQGYEQRDRDHLLSNYDSSSAYSSVVIPLFLRIPLSSSLVLLLLLVLVLVLVPLLLLLLLLLLLFLLLLLLSQSLFCYMF